jgi:predicted MFS family arabinose efflux permease
MLLGGALGAPVGGVVAALIPGTAGFRLAFVVCAVLCLAIAVSLRLMLPAMPPSSAGDRPRLSVPRLALPPILRLALVLGMLGHYLRGGIENTALPLVGDSRGFSTASIGLTLGLLAAVEIALLRSSTALFARIEPARCLLAALAVGVVAAGVLAVSSGLTGFIAAAVMFGVVDAIAMVAPPLIIISLSPDAATGLASYRIACGFGSLLGSTSVTAAVAAAGAVGALSVVGGALIASITLLGAMSRRVTTS